MKRIMMALSAALMLTACGEHEMTGELTARMTPADSVMKKTITFDFGNLSQQAMTRATLAELNLTDLWIFDYIGEELKQTIHQASTDASFGSASLSLDYGEHTFYFVASRGIDPVVDTDAKTIVWSSVRDTFLASLSIDVQPSSATSQSVTLSRCVGRLRISATDVVPANAAKLTITPSTWYYGLNYQTGEAVAPGTSPIVVNIPSSYVGTQNLVTSCYTISGSSAWQTNITVSLMASDESSLGSVTIPNVPIQRNHITSYSGGIVGAGRSISVNASDDDWVDDGNVNW
jgi:hypothetical protein